MAAAGTAKAKLVQEIHQTHRQAEMRWLATEGKQYAGQWVVVEGDRLFAAGPDGKALYDRARAAGIEVPFVVRIPVETNEPFGGW